MAAKVQHKQMMKMQSAEEEAILQHNSGKKSKVCYIASELYTKGELFYFLADKGGLPVNVCRYYGRQLVEALRFMHNNGVAHRDLKCENILLNENYDLKISDFGFACPVSG